MARPLLRFAAALAIVAGVLWVQPRRVEPPARVAGSGLNLRSAPDVRAQRVAVLPAGSTVEVQRCLADASWCNVRHGERSGWVAAGYLLARHGGGQVSVARVARELGVPVETAHPGG
ncbi:SH3 domain-containing protein [Stenotrophomonas mori]|uniref:SH3 domain-containing protein n=1 Tax=Stenotrophomonas mori TaxID=2871096 RepID=A0ABT0SJC7_9GAMM|nr:SH3 domain-containing protein [Stenotrophomonas mori]MCL7715221.1 SH3 domain-containing protein [Stenotrophomonas mori]